MLDFAVSVYEKFPWMSQLQSVLLVLKICVPKWAPFREHK